MKQLQQGLLGGSADGPTKRRKCLRCDVEITTTIQFRLCSMCRVINSRQPDEPECMRTGRVPKCEGAD